VKIFKSIFDSKFLCRFGWHDWDKWEVKTVDLQYLYTNKPSHELSIQVRECQICGKIERRHI